MRNTMREPRRPARPGAVAVCAALSAAVALSACVSSPAPEAAPTPAAPSGQSLFAQHCSACHGPLAEGDGPVANVMRVTVPSLRTLRARANGTFPREAVMRYIDGRDLPAAHGDRYMPVWGEQLAADNTDGSGSEDGLADQRISAIVAYLERLQN